jgi:hypothetical protein
MEIKRRRTQILIETHEVKVIRLRKTRVLAICERCGEIVTALASEQPAEVTEPAPDDEMQKASSTVCK